jgi:glutamyl-tRNA reductase
MNRGDDPEQVLAQLARAITNKLIHAPTTGLKKASAEGRHDVLDHAARLLNLSMDVLEPQRQPKAVTAKAKHPSSEEQAVVAAAPDAMGPNEGNRRKDTQSASGDGPLPGEKAEARAAGPTLQ